MVEAEIVGMNMETASLTGALSDRQPDVIEGWETKLYVDALGGTPGTTQKTGLLLNWEVEINNKLEPKYFADNSKNARAIVGQ